MNQETFFHKNLQTLEVDANWGGHISQHKQ